MEGPTCSYLTSGGACDGSITCSCDNGHWSCVLGCGTLEDASSGDSVVDAGEPEGSATVGIDSGDETYGGMCMISATSYDQSCAVDSDCTEVTSADYCSANCLCGGSAINTAALSQFDEDVSKTPLGSGAFGPGAGRCPCPFLPAPCCRNGSCTTQCLSPSDTLAACADVGGSCFRQADTTCQNPGPPNSCAYLDEVCCL